MLARGSPKFESTDIVPLVNKAFQSSFAIQGNVQKAIARRGWNPLNYKLLENFQGPTPDVATDTATVTISVAPSLNVLHCSASLYMDLLLEEAK